MVAGWEGLRDSIEDVRMEWQTFRRGGPSAPAVRPPIALSWQRCQETGIPERSPGGGVPVLSPVLDASGPLLAAAEPVLERLRTALDQTNQVLVLCDAAGHALRVEGDSAARRTAGRINLVPGSDWSEAASGTNAMGTALVEACHVTVFATEHYLEELHPWACVAAPIRHPVTGLVLGVLDLSGRHMLVSHHTEMAVIGAVQAIQAQLAAREAALHESLFAALSDRLTSLRQGGAGVIDRHGRLLHFAGLHLPQPASWSAAAERIMREADEFEEVHPEAPSLRFRYRPLRQDGEIIGALVEACRASGTPSPPVESPFPGLVGRDPRWLNALERAARAARTGSTVLLTGETGTGKEMVARAIHQNSSRAHRPFVALNCGALPPSLATSELFGYAGGAFTGANPRGSAGLFEQAHQGTLFLDEVSELSPEAQVALLRVLQEREVMRIGARLPVKVDVRVIAASNRDLADLTARGLFRQDLFFRLNVFPVALPPLRERAQDIIPLVTYGYQRLSAEPPSLPPSSWQRLLDHRWPGNVRELFNLIEQAVTLNEDPADLLTLPSLTPTPVIALAEGGEAEQIRQALDENQGNAAAAARVLGMSRSTLYRKLELYGIRLKRQVE